MKREETLDEWLNRIRRSHAAHNVAAAKFERLGRRIGIAAAVSAALVGTAVFASLEATPNLYLKIGTGLLSITAAVLATLQTYLKYPESAERHKIAAVEFGDLRRKIEKLQVLHSVDSLEATIAELDAEWSELSRKGPIISQVVWDTVNRKIEKAKNATDLKAA